MNPFIDQRSADAIGAYLTYVLANVGLPEWSIQLVDESCADDTYAEIEPVSGQKLANLRLCKAFLELPAERIRHVLIHECLHLAHRDVTDLVRLGLCRLVGQQTYDLFQEAQRQHVELMVDRLAEAFADYFRAYPRENRLLYAIRNELPPPAKA